MLQRSKTAHTLTLTLGVLLILGCPSMRKEPKLTVNEDIFVEWISMERAAADARRVLDESATQELLSIFNRVVQQEFGGGVVTSVQMRYRDYGSYSESERYVSDDSYNGGAVVSGGFKGGILRGERQESTIALYQLPDDSTWTEWANIPSTVAGSHLVVPRAKVDEISEQVQSWFGLHYGKDIMANEMQISVNQGRRLIIILGTCRWVAPSRHLHTILVA